MTSWHPITLTPTTTVTQKMRQTGRHARTQINASQCLQVQVRTGRVGRVSESSPRPRGARLSPLGNNHDAITQCRKLSYKRRPYREDSYVLLEVEDLIIIHFNSYAGLPQCPPKGKKQQQQQTRPFHQITDTERLDDHWVPLHSRPFYSFPKGKSLLAQLLGPLARCPQRAPRPWTYYIQVRDRDAVMIMSWCLMSSDVSWHIMNKWWPMPKHGSINLYVHGNQKAR